MKNNKFCVSKTLIYLLMLLILGAGFFWELNYMNSQKMGNKSEASSANIPQGEKQCENSLGLKNIYNSISPKIKVLCLSKCEGGRY